MREETELTIASRPSLLRAWLPAAVWVCLIAFETTDFFSSGNTGSMLYSLWKHLFGNVDLHFFIVFHHYLRKTGHVVGYGMLSLLLLRGWRATFGQIPALLLRATLLAWLGTLSVAALDEWHQSFIPSRTGTVWDVLLDSIAGVAFLVIAYWWLRRTED